MNSIRIPMQMRKSYKWFQPQDDIIPLFDQDGADIIFKP